MMEPRQVEQDALFYEFSIESHVPADHLVRSIDRFVELAELRKQLAPFYSETGRPSVDPCCTGCSCWNMVADASSGLALLRIRLPSGFPGKSAKPAAGTQCLSIWFEIATVSMARLLRGAFARWAFATDRQRRDRLGRTGMSND